MERSRPPHRPPAGRLRIAVFVSEFPALSETFVLRQVVGLIERGHDVTVFADRPRDEPLTHPDFERFNIGARTRYLGMPADRIERLRTAASGVMRHVRQHPRMLLRALDAVRHGRDALNLRLLFWTLRLVDEAPFDVLHCHFGPVGAMVATLRSIGAVQGRLTTTFHGADLTACLREQPDRYHHLTRQGDLFLPISEYLGERLRALGCRPERIAVLRMGVDLDRFADRPRPASGGGPLRLLTVGRLIEKKGIADALRAVALARRRGMVLFHTIIGDGPLRESLKELVHELGIEDAVRFCGWQTQDVVTRSLYTHHVLLAPSVTATDGDQEGIPVTLMEAMATGMPVISTWHSGIPELVEDGVSGLLVAENDPHALAEALLRLADSPPLARRMGRKARDRVSAAYNAATLDERLDGLLKGLALSPG